MLHWQYTKRLIFYTYWIGAIFIIVYHYRAPFGGLYKRMQFFLKLLLSILIGYNPLRRRRMIELANLAESNNIEKIFAYMGSL